MDLSKILTVAGKPGLYRVIAQGRQAIIAESLIDGKRIPVHATLRVSTLEEIRMFTTGDDVPLSDVLKRIFDKEKGGAAVDPQSDPEVLFAKLAEVLPDHDRDRIYPSDVRKLYTWYAQLLKAGIFAEKDEAKADGDEADKVAKAADKVAGKGTKERSSVAVKKANAPKPGGGSKAKSAGTAMRKSSQRGS